MPGDRDGSAVCTRRNINNRHPRMKRFYMNSRIENENFPENVSGFKKYLFVLPILSVLLYKHIINFNNVSVEAILLDR